MGDSKMETLNYLPLQFEAASTTDHLSRMPHEKTALLGSYSDGLLHVDENEKLNNFALHFRDAPTNNDLFSLHHEKAVKVKPLTTQILPTSSCQMHPCDRGMSRSCDVGHAITLFCPCPVSLTQPLCTKSRLSAMCYIDVHTTQLIIVPKQNSMIEGPILIGLDDVLVVGPARDFALFFDPTEKMMSDRDLQLATVIQYISLEGRACRLCFLLDTHEQQKQFMDMFTSLCYSQSRYASNKRIDPGHPALKL